MSADRKKGRTPKVVLAAGGVVWRLEAAVAVDSAGRPRPTASEGVPVGLQMVVVHRPRYDDWSLPKGKAERGETGEQTALREVEEETGLRCVLGRELLTVRYETVRGEDKTVRWWAMTVGRDLGFEPNDEVDEVRWVGHDEFSRLCEFESDREVVHALATSGVLDQQI